jgi:hypothetical protein
VTVELTDQEARQVRRLARRILELVPDPDRPVHGHDAGRDRTLCGRGGPRPRLTGAPERVTCKACQQTAMWDAWAWSRREPE